MQRILRKRIFRDFKENIFRYIALGGLIILGMYMVVSLISAADTVMGGVDQNAANTCLEDGEFKVFVPLSDDEKDKLVSDMGIELEEQFYMDYKVSGETVGDKDTLRVFKVREDINKLNIETGSEPVNDDELVLEKRYCEDNNLSVGDTVTIGGLSMKICGICTTADYDAMYKDMSDSIVDSAHFGTAFVTDSQYEHMKSSGKSNQSEIYIYAFRLGDKMGSDELKDKLQNLVFDENAVSDKQFKKYWKETAGRKEQMEDAVAKLDKATEKMSDALEKLSSNSDSIDDGAESVFDAYLDETQNGLEQSGLNVVLTESNYKSELNKIVNQSDNALYTMKINSIIDELDLLKKYKDGVTKYTGGVDRVYNGADKVSTNMSKLNDKTTELLDEFWNVDISNLVQFTKSDDNPRVKASADDQKINQIGGIVAGVIIMILFTYVLSVFVVHGIEKESSIIGALYSLGVRKSDLMLHYLTLPVSVAWLAGIIGTVVGFSKWGLNYQMQDCYDYFSVPELSNVYSVYLIIYGAIMPPVVAGVVNYFVIQRKLSKPALKMLRNEQKTNKMRNINLGSMGYMGRFRIRQMIRELRTGFTVVFGMFIALLIAMMGLDCFAGCEYISVQNKKDTKFEYMYTYKYPTEKVPDGGEACYAESLRQEAYGYDLDVTIMGIDDQNKYYNVDVNEGKNKIVVSNSVAQKYQLSVGDTFVLKDEENNVNYAFDVEDIVQYSSGLYVFMDIDSMRELFDQSDDYYNVVLSDEKLDIPSGRLYSTTSKTDIARSSDIFISQMMPMIYMMTVLSGIIFCVVMYLMLSVMVDRQAMSISLLKIFGYRQGEIKKLYLNGNFYIVSVGAAICIPLSKLIMDSIYPYLVANVSCSMELTFSWQIYALLYSGIIILYLIINRILVMRVNKLQPAEVLKNRE